jgi:hypothetical protein
MEITDSIAAARVPACASAAERLNIVLCGIYSVVTYSRNPAVYSGE